MGVTDASGSIYKRTLKGLKKKVYSKNSDQSHTTVQKCYCGTFELLFRISKKYLLVEYLGKILQYLLHKVLLSQQLSEWIILKMYNQEDINS